MVVVSAGEDWEDPPTVIVDFVHPYGRSILVKQTAPVLLHGV